MSPSNGGSSPPNPPPVPIPPDNPDLSISRRISTRSSNAAKNSTEQNGSPNSAGLSIGSNKGVQKPAKSGKGRQPLSNISVNDLVNDKTSFNLQEREAAPFVSCKSAIPETAAAMETEETGVESTPLVAGLYPSDPSIIAVNQGNSSSFTACVTPSKSPCTTNSVSAEIPTPVKTLNFDGEDDLEVEGWDSEEDDETTGQDNGRKYPSRGLHVGDLTDIQKLDSNG